jgi:hypothetical protein
MDDKSEIERLNFSLVTTIGINEAYSEEEKPYQFSSIVSVDCDNDGNIYVLDRVETCVRIFNRDGKFLRQILQRGQGPNEIETPYRLSFNKFSSSVFVLHKSGFEIKGFDIFGNLLSQIKLPEQMNGYFKFIQENKILIVARHFPAEYEYKNFNVVNLESQKIEKELVPINRPEISNIYQRFITIGGTIWTCPGDKLELKAYDLETGEQKRSIPIKEDYKEFKIKERDAYGGKIRYIYFYNFAQPLLLNDNIYMLVKKQEFRDESKESLIDPEITKFSLYLFKDDSMVEIADLIEYGKLELASVWQNRILLFSRNPYPYIKILEIIN